MYEGLSKFYEDEKSLTKQLSTLLESNITYYGNVIAKLDEGIKNLTLTNRMLTSENLMLRNWLRRNITTYENRIYLLEEGLLGGLQLLMISLKRT